jgi:hypothetical protein
MSLSNANLDPFTMFREKKKAGTSRCRPSIVSMVDASKSVVKGQRRIPS